MLTVTQRMGRFYICSTRGPREGMLFNQEQVFVVKDKSVFKATGMSDTRLPIT